METEPKAIADVLPPIIQIHLQFFPCLVAVPWVELGVKEGAVAQLGLHQLLLHPLSLQSMEHVKAAICSTGRCPAGKPAAAGAPLRQFLGFGSAFTALASAPPKSLSFSRSWMRACSSWALRLSLFDSSAHSSQGWQVVVAWGAMAVPVLGARYCPQGAPHTDAMSSCTLPVWVLCSM